MEKGHEAKMKNKGTLEKREPLSDTGNDKRRNGRWWNNAQGIFSRAVARYLGASTRHLYSRARVRYENSRYWPSPSALAEKPMPRFRVTVLASTFSEMKGFLIAVDNP